MSREKKMMMRRRKVRRMRIKSIVIIRSIMMRLTDSALDRRKN